jgi:methylmalonyl-CoA/ethylmalonyl-CoA epimerase
MFKRIDHIGIAVKDISKATEVFSNVLGLQVAKQEEIEDQQLIAALIPTANVRFELMQPTVSDSVVGKFLERRGEGIHHICFEVENITEEIKTLQSRNVQVIGGSPREGFVGQIEFIHPKSANGVLTEIAEVDLRTPSDTNLSVHHIILATLDRDKAVDNWVNNLSLKLNKKAKRDDAPLITAMLDAGNSQIEFVQQTAKTGPVIKRIESQGEGIYAVALETDDANALQSKFEQQGIRVIEDKQGDNIARLVHPLDFFGTLIMFNEKKR